MNEEAVNQQIKTVLTQTIQMLFPITTDAKNLIKRHVWRDKVYVGVDPKGGVASWRGWSANLVNIDFRYRTIFADIVDNVLPAQERVRLFGNEFASKINSYQKFVVLFVLDFPLDTFDIINEQGFIQRRLTKALHACVIAEADEFINTPALLWAAKVTKLVMLQRFLSTHRKPYDNNEVPFQHLLYKTGFLHSYIVKGGLHLYQLSQPRKAGEFGHDFHALVNNPLLPTPSLPFPIGIELYTGSLGYHIDTIPQYITRFRLRGVIIVAKDNPFNLIEKFMVSTTTTAGTSVFFASNLTEVGFTEATAIHYLPLDTIMIELSNIRDELEIFIPSVPSNSLV